MTNTVPVAASPNYDPNRLPTIVNQMAIGHNNFAAVRPLSVPFERGIRSAQHLPLVNAGSALTVVIVGDSRATPLSDQIVATDYFSQQVKRKLLREFPTKTFTYYERAIVGAGWSHLDAASLASTGLTLPSWATPSTNSWLSFVSALAPDLIVFELGANTGVPGTEMAAFYSVMGKVAAFTKVPDRIFSTSEAPSFTTGGLTGVAMREARHQQASMLRGYCLRNNFGFIDKNRWASILRDGIDPLRSVFVQPTAQINFNSGGLPWTTPYTTHDMSIIFQLAGVPASQLRSGSAGAFKIGIGSLSDNTFEIWKDAGTGNFFINSRLTGTLLPYSAINTGVACPASGTMYFEFIVKGQWVQLGFSTTTQIAGNFTPIWSGYTERAGGLFTPFFSQAGSGGQVFFINSFCTSTPSPHTPLTSDTEMFGVVPGGQGGSVTNFGGNGTNHLSTQGLSWVTATLLDRESFA
jgi:hypothetical protein